mmetsp:Transcript_14944/g.42486  ORF Transcript_14944/g.42486 Transcript_14944/m.42486 type:complete len:252 (+) Transcript_14944:521-1276(+)
MLLGGEDALLAAGGALAARRIFCETPTEAAMVATASGGAFATAVRTWAAQAAGGQAVALLALGASPAARTPSEAAVATAAMRGRTWQASPHEIAPKARQATAHVAWSRRLCVLLLGIRRQWCARPAGSAIQLVELADHTSPGGTTGAMSDACNTMPIVRSGAAGRTLVATASASHIATLTTRGAHCRHCRGRRNRRRSKRACRGILRCGVDQVRMPLGFQACDPKCGLVWHASAVQALLLLQRLVRQQWEA